MEALQLLGIVVFGIVVFAALTAFAVALVVKNEFLSLAQSREAQFKADQAMRELVAVELELRARDSEAGTGRQNDAKALSEERAASLIGAFQKAANDPLKPNSALFGPFPRRRCKFCEKWRNRIFGKTASPMASDVAAATFTRSPAIPARSSGEPWLSGK